MLPTTRWSLRTRSRSRSEERSGKEGTRTPLEGIEEETAVSDTLTQCAQNPEADLDEVPSDQSSGSLTSEDSVGDELKCATEGEEGTNFAHPNGDARGRRGDKMAEVRGVTIVPGKFRGGVEENVEEYLTQFERVAKANGWDEAKKKVILPCYLDGAALKWFENLESTQGDIAGVTWVQIKEGMKETFQGIAWEEQVEYRLRMRMQDEAEPVESYVQDVLNLCQKVDARMNERSKIKYVLRGLKPSLLEKVMVMDNDTLANLMANIRKIETARFMAGQRVDHIMTEPRRGISSGAMTSPPVPSSAISSLENKLENLTSEFSKLGMRLLEQQNQRTPQYVSTNLNGTARGRTGTDRPVRGGSHNGWTRGRARGGYGEARRGRTSDGRVICYKCNRPGHYAIACGSNPGNEEGGR